MQFHRTFNMLAPDCIFHLDKQDIVRGRERTECKQHSESHRLESVAQIVMHNRQQFSSCKPSFFLNFFECSEPDCHDQTLLSFLICCCILCCWLSCVDTFGGSDNFTADVGQPAVDGMLWGCYSDRTAFSFILISSFQLIFPFSSFPKPLS